MGRRLKTGLMTIGLGLASLNPALADYTPGALPPGCSADILQALITTSGAAAANQNIGNILNPTGAGSGTQNGVVTNTNPTGIAMTGSGNSITYTAADGTQYTQTGGSAAWRNNNPGNIVYGPYAISQGAIGQNGNFAVFPDASTGTTALGNLLGGSTYQSLTVDQAISRYAPAFENNTSAYQSFVSTQLGTSGSTSMSSLSAAQMSTLQSAIQQQEGYIPGTTTKI